MKFEVSVDMTLYCTGKVKVTAKNAEEALDKINKNILSGKLQTTDVEWSDPEYEDNSFKTTGDVD